VVAGKRESRIALDRTGAERLAGDGDMIFTKDENDPGVRIQAALATDEEIDRVAGFLRNEVSVE
jgi:S-DNA-T family DNA segregation ATPase FtsK/SpoIIIE